jgi:hypothetical protein
VSSFGVQAVTRRRFPADGSPARQLLQPETTRAVMEMAGRPASGNDAMGQNAKHSNRANAFRFTPELRHCSEQLACLKGATSRHRVDAPSTQ